MISRAEPIQQKHGFWKDGRMFVRVPPSEARAFGSQFPRAVVVIKAYGEFTVFELRNPAEQTAALVSIEFQNQ